MEAALTEGSRTRPTMPSSAPRRVLVSIPCFNEELAIGGVVLKARTHVADVLVVDDGSGDGTARAAHLAGATVVRHETNAGKGAALRTAFRYAADNGYDAFVVLDGDGQHDADEIPKVVAPILREHEPADLVIGARSGEGTQMPRYRRAGKRILDLATSAATGASPTDSQSGFRALGRRAIEVLASESQTSGFGVESEMLVLARQHDWRLEEVPVHARYEGVDGSTQNPVAHAASVLDRIVVLLFMRRPLLTVGLPGLLWVVFGAYWGLRMLNVYKAQQIFVMSYGLAAATFVIVGGVMIATALMLNMIVLLRGHVNPTGRRP